MKELVVAATRSFVSLLAHFVLGKQADDIRFAAKNKKDFSWCFRWHEAFKKCQTLRFVISGDSVITLELALTEKKIFFLQTFFVNLQSSRIFIR